MPTPRHTNYEHPSLAMHRRILTWKRAVSAVVPHFLQYGLELLEPEGGAQREPGVDGGQQHATQQARHSRATGMLVQDLRPVRDSNSSEHGHFAKPALIVRRPSTTQTYTLDAQNASERRAEETTVNQHVSAVQCNALSNVSCCSEICWHTSWHWCRKVSRACTSGSLIKGRHTAAKTQHKTQRVPC